MLQQNAVEPYTLELLNKICAQRPKSNLKFKIQKVFKFSNW